MIDRLVDGEYEANAFMKVTRGGVVEYRKVSSTVTIQNGSQLEPGEGEETILSETEYLAGTS